MIFVSVGSTHFPFDRLIKCIDSAVENKSINRKVFAQIGSSNYIPKYIAYKKYLSFHEMTNYITKSTITVIHAGVGSVLLSLKLGKIPVLYPRLSGNGELVDNHQMEFAKKIQVINKVIVAYDEKELINAIRNYHSLVDEIKNKKSANYDNLKLDKYLIENFS